MKKITVATSILASIFLAACSSNAPVAQQQVFGDVAPATLTIAQVKQQPDDARVTFTGKIVRQVKHDEYIVADETGEIQVEIDEHRWNGLKVTSSELIRIYGEVDKEVFSTKVDAKSVEKVQ